jgi:Holliday junction resolvase
MARRAPLERTIVAKGMAVAKQLGFYPIKLHGGAYSLAGLPDVLCLKDGRAYWIEFKRPGCEPTRLQQHRIRELIACGCPATVAHSAGDVREFLEAVA